MHVTTLILNKKRILCFSEYVNLGVSLQLFLSCNNLDYNQFKNQFSKSYWSRVALETVPLNIFLGGRGEVVKTEGKFIYLSINFQLSCRVNHRNEWLKTASLLLNTWKGRRYPGKSVQWFTQWWISGSPSNNHKCRHKENNLLYYNHQFHCIRWLFCVCVFFFTFF